MKRQNVKFQGNSKNLITSKYRTNSIKESNEDNDLWLIDVLTKPQWGIGMGKSSYYKYNKLLVKYITDDGEILDARVSLNIESISIQPRKQRFYTTAHVTILGSTIDITGNGDVYLIEEDATIVFDDYLFTLDRNATLEEILDY